MVKCVSHVCFVVSDLEESIRFYTEKLGLRVAFDFKSATGVRHGVYLHVGARSFVELFTGAPQPAPEKASFRHICLEVDSIVAIVASLRAAGVEVSDPKLGGDGSLQSWLKDPDGNAIELHEFLPDSLQAAALARTRT